MAHKIYIADDEKNIRELLKNFLQSDGYEVSAFENGDSLLCAFEKEPISVFVSGTSILSAKTECSRRLASLRV